MSNLKKCSNCGKSLKKDEDYCIECGTKYEEEVNVVYEPKKTYSVLERRTDNPSNVIVPVVIASFVTLIISFCLMIGYIQFAGIGKTSTTKTKVNRNITLTDEGIAEAVEKIYDAVVVIENLNGNKIQATGTGFVYKTSNGKAYILTNQHVVEGADKVNIVFTDETEAEAKIVGGDKYSDVAVLSVSEDKIIDIASIGSSEELRVGDTTFTVGAPLDSTVYSWTVTRGILSGKNRLVEVSTSNSRSIFGTVNDYIMKVLQTDAAINSGNSGGPLCNASGEVIGITNMKIASSSVEGMGFAIPIEDAIKYADIFISGKEIEYPYFGISLYDYTGNDGTGVYVQTVESDSPAAKAGLKRGDLIVSFAGVETKNTAYFKYELYKHSPGETVEVNYIRDNKEHTTKVKLK